MAADPRIVDTSTLTALIDDTTLQSDVVVSASDTYPDVLRKTGSAAVDAFTDDVDPAVVAAAAAVSKAFALSVLAKRHPKMTKAVGALARYKNKDIIDIIDASAFLVPFAYESMTDVVRIAREKFGMQLFPVPAVYRTFGTGWATVRARETIHGHVGIVAIRALVRTEITLLKYDTGKVGQRWIDLAEGGAAANCGKVVCTLQLSDALDALNVDDNPIFTGFDLDPGDIVFAHAGMPIKCTPYRDVPDDQFLVQTLALTTVDNTEAWAQAVKAQGIIQETLLGAYLGTNLIVATDINPAKAVPAFVAPPKPKITGALQTAYDTHDALNKRIRVICDRDAAEKRHVWDAHAFETTANRHRSTEVADIAVPSYRACLNTLTDKVSTVESKYDEFAALEKSVDDAMTLLKTELADQPGRMTDKQLIKCNSLMKKHAKHLTGICYASLKSTSKVTDFTAGVAELFKAVDDGEIARMPPIPDFDNDIHEIVMLGANELREFIHRVFQASMPNGEIAAAVAATKRHEWSALWLEFRTKFKELCVQSKASGYVPRDVTFFTVRFAAFQGLLLVPAQLPLQQKKKKRREKRARDASDEAHDIIDLCNSDGEDEANDPAMQIDPKDKAVKRDADGKPCLDANGDPILLNAEGGVFVVDDDEEDGDSGDEDEEEDEEDDGPESDGGDDEDDEDFSNKGRSKRLRKRVERSGGGSGEDSLAHRVLHCKRHAVNVREFEELVDTYLTFSSPAAVTGDKTKHEEALRGRVAGIELRTHLWSVLKRDKKTGAEALLVPSYFASEAEAVKIVDDRKAIMADLDDPNEYVVRSQPIA